MPARRRSTSSTRSVWGWRQAQPLGQAARNLCALVFFVTHLVNAKRDGLREYSLVATRYVAEFRRKWIEGQTAKEAVLIGSPDIQSLADLANSYAIVGEMRLVPIGKRAVLRLALLIALPIFPLTLTMIPLEQIIDRAVGMFF